MAAKTCLDPDCRSESIIDMDEGAYMCEECGKEYTEVDFKYAGFKIGVVNKVEEKGKLKVCMISVGGPSDLQIVTNAKHISEGEKVVVATEGAIVPAGADAETGTVVAKANVGGTPSSGMLCDCPMLGWSGGAAGVLVTLEAGEMGTAPPAERPRK
mmetsp:Transcript_51908/g.126582  ORF Transcript_51908/g.126582 Transcript_51908/m.126582 type:complete len:156 (+) Transcript_51908:100-567(+)|eukprot:CAMPEP_0206257492 /NCGR_PEP_ID=MMETSP0047_2-20121206/25371_1 /ASSEMBLY_ACC=CAM_ASM_000192 /TAXON_ID=195065 /ORGANISM="Chroomonas mesostigmatica_cf, Strain CCMP1168" /LENGTH=155 /DNA_ID=CAMNT_0053684085 /DNA_START=44 /DNA_END=511 /DNA_ORIENTATION=+